MVGDGDGASGGWWVLVINSTMSIRLIMVNALMSACLYIC